MASTCGLKCFSICAIVALLGCRPAGTLPPFAGVSHTTTPEKSLCRRTLGSRESASATLPLTLAAQTGARHPRLKLIRQSQIIVVVQAVPVAKVGGARLCG